MLGGIFRRRQRVASPELGELGTRAFVVTDWQPGPTSWRPVNPGDAPTEPLRRSRATHGPMVMSADLGFPLFQGGKTPAPGEGVRVEDYLDRYAEAMGASGYPS